MAGAEGDWEKELFNCFWFCFVLFFSYLYFSIWGNFFLPQKAKTIKILDA